MFANNLSYQTKFTITAPFGKILIDQFSHDQISLENISLGRSDWDESTWMDLTGKSLKNSPVCKLLCSLHPQLLLLLLKISFLIVLLEMVVKACELSVTIISSASNLAY